MFNTGNCASPHRPDFEHKLFPKTIAIAVSSQFHFTIPPRPQTHTLDNPYLVPDPSCGPAPPVRRTGQ